MDFLNQFLSTQHLSLAILVTAILLSAVFLSYFQHQSRTEEPLPGFPIVSLEEEGLSPRDSWSQHGLKVQAKGLREHDGAFQVMTATGPKVRYNILRQAKMASKSPFDYCSGL